MSAVVTGTGVLCTTAGNTDDFARALREGRCGIKLRPGGGTEDSLIPLASAELEAFDFRRAVTVHTGLPAQVRRDAVRVASRAPLAVRAAVVVALEAFERAELHRTPAPTDRIGLVVAGHNLGGRRADEMRLRYAASPAYLPGRYALQYLDTDTVGTVSEVLGLTGEGYTVGGSSASGNVAIINAVRLLAVGAVDVCLVLGALTDLSDMERQAYYNLGAMAGRRCLPFDADREGFVPGHGTACLILETPKSASRRGVLPTGWVLGHAQRLAANSLADPSAEREAWVMNTAVRRAGLAPSQIGYVNLHGTGSPLGDETEVKALHLAFGPDACRPWLNSTKGLVGHCLCAAGVVEAVATLVQLRHGFVHPNAGLTRPIDPDSRFVGNQAEPAAVDHALSNGFGFGGFNTSVVLARHRAGWS